jgi:hypothetical protein
MHLLWSIAMELAGLSLRIVSYIPQVPHLASSHLVTNICLPALNFSVPEFLPRCGMVMDPLERYEVEMERIERKRLLEAESVQALIRQEREKWETREAFKQLKHQEKEAHRGHRRSSSASEFVKKFIHRRADSGVAFTEVEKALQVEESAGVEKVGVMETGDSEELEGGPRMLKERVRLVKKVLKFLGW